MWLRRIVLAFALAGALGIFVRELREALLAREPPKLPPPAALVPPSPRLHIWGSGLVEPDALPDGCTDPRIDLFRARLFWREAGEDPSELIKRKEKDKGGEV